jgi:hypothetical protein
MDAIGFPCVLISSSTVHLHESLCSRRACACSEAGFSSQNVDCAWGVYYRRAAFCCSIFCGKTNSMQRMFTKKCFLFTVGSVCRVKRFTTGSRNFNKDFRKSQMVPDQARKWLREESKHFYAAGIDALVRRWDSCINVGGGYVENQMFLSGSGITYFTFYIHLRPI